jgi:3-oxoacyl-[acyl-carrier protein] reductase
MNLAKSLNGRTVVVTGGSQGIGKGMARVFAGKGFNVAVVARDLERAEKTVSGIKECAGRAKAFKGDVTSRESMESAVKAVVGEYGGIDVLCANAGVFPSATLEEMTAANWDHVLNTNARGTFFSLQACLPYLKQAEDGRVIITSSITGPNTGYPGWAHYAASKAAQLGFMRTAALELASSGITVNAVLPGNVMTEGLEGVGEEYIQKMTASIPLKKLGTVEDIAHAAVFLASKEAGFITGQTLIIDGGQTLPENNDAIV